MPKQPAWRTQALFDVTAVAASRRRPRIEEIEGPAFRRPFVPSEPRFLLGLDARVLVVDDRLAAGVAREVARGRRVVSAGIRDLVGAVRRGRRVDAVVRLVDRIRRRDAEVERAEQRARDGAARAIRAVMVDRILFERRRDLLLVAFATRRLRFSASMQEVRDED